MISFSKYKQISITAIGLVIILISVALLSSSSNQLQSRKLTVEDESVQSSIAWKQELFSRIERIRKVCGELCSIETLDDFKRKTKKINGYPTFTAHIDCNRLMSSDDVDAGDLTFPAEIPKEIEAYYTLNGLIPIKPFPRFFKDAYLGEEARSNVWSKEDIDEKIEQLREGILKGTYNWSGITAGVKSKLEELDLKGKSILVIGSEDPWVEVICLALGAAKVTTLEYGKIVSQHPQIEAFTPNTFREKFIEKTLQNFDGVVSISSLEHSGLGRYGDALNPWGDLIATGRAWCVTKSNGFLVLGLPGGSEDSIRYNAHRMYGKYRWPLITTNWEVQNLDMNKNYLMEKNTPNTVHSFKKIDLYQENPTLSAPNTQDQWKKELFTRLDRVRETCGELCSINNLRDFNNKAQNINGYPTFTANIDCDRLIADEDIDASDFTFPTEIPEELVSYYTLDGLIPIKPFPRFYKDAYLGKEARSNIWSKEEIEQKIEQAREGIFKGTYKWSGLTFDVKSKLEELDLKGKSILVIGSEDPWVEVICLALGAAKVTTLEYGKIMSQHPQVEALTPDAFREKFSKKLLETFDGVVSISSLEHSGLGRYGDALNPWGDLIATARAWCVTKSNGFLLLGLPGGSEDSIRYNAHRMYGKYRWPLITTNWEVQNLKMNKNYLVEKNTPNTMHSFKKIEGVTTSTKK